MSDERKSLLRSIMTHQLADRPHPTYILFLYFKALYFNKDYRKFWSSIVKDKPDDFEELLEKYPLLQTLRGLFGNPYQFAEAKGNKDIEITFSEWIKEYGGNFIPLRASQFQIINEGKEIIPKAGTVYITAPEEADCLALKLNYHQNITEAISMLDSYFNDYWLPMSSKTKMWKTDKIEATAQRLDCFVWLEIQSLSYKEAILKAYESGDYHWSKLKADLYYEASEYNISVKELDGDSMSDQRSHFSNRKNEGVKVVANLLKGEFPSAT